MLLVAAISDSPNLDKFVESYRQSIFPTEESNKALAEKYKEFLEEESQRDYTVKWEPSEAERNFL